jgi:WD40 repeat protein
MENLIRGDITEASMKDLIKIVPKRKLIVFVSSTFIDTKLERDILHTKILPDLQRTALRSGIEVIFYDMRFGIRDDNTLNHMTWTICKDAILQCYDGSDGLFFLSLQADRYGFLPLPKYLEENIIVQILESVNPNPDYVAAKELLLDWYILDENHRPPRYELKRLSSLPDPSFDHALPILRGSLLNSVIFEPLSHVSEGLQINHSVTEWETLFALNCDKKGCYWLHRSFNKELLRSFSSGNKVSELTDIFNSPSPEMKLEALKSKMKSNLKDNQKLHLSSLVSPVDYLSKETCSDYLNLWESAIRQRLEMELEKVIEKGRVWDNGILGIPVDYLNDIIHHCSTAFSRARMFFGREDLVDSAVQKLRKEKVVNLELMNEYKVQQETTLIEKRIFSGVDLALIGGSGCGKSSLMSKLAFSSFGAGGVPTIIRLCGTSSFSLHGLKLIQSISIQLLACYKKDHELKSLIEVLHLQTYHSGIELFQSLISQYPVYLFIDSLDQLDENEETGELRFLCDIQPHVLSRIVVSSLPDQRAEHRRPEFSMFEQRLRVSGVLILPVGVMNNIEPLLDKLLKHRHRKLTESQCALTMDAIVQEPTILYISLAVEIIAQWRSFETKVTLKPTAKGLIHQVFSELEKTFGEAFTTFAFALITFSRAGINDMEMQDLLSVQNEVLKEIFQYFNLDSFPMHAWLRLKSGIKGLIAEKENHCIKWFHAQVWETAVERYSAQKKESHEMMGRYFCSLPSNNCKTETREQPLTLNALSVWSSESVINKRRAIEGSYQLIQGELLEEALNEVCSLESICCSALSGDLLNCVRHVGELIDLFKNEIPQKLDHYYRWVRKYTTTIVCSPRSQVRMTAAMEPVVSEVGMDLARLNRKELEDYGRILGPVTFGSITGFDSVELELIGHTDAVTVVTSNENGSRIISGSMDTTIRIWDGETVGLLKTLEGHRAPVLTVAWEPNTEKIISGSRDGKLAIWEGNAGTLLKMWKGHSSYVSSVAWSHDGKLIVSGATRSYRDIDVDTTIKIWEGENGKLVKELVGHTDAIKAIAWNLNDTKIASASHDKTIKIWDAVTGLLIVTLVKLSSEFSTMAWSYDDSRIVSGTLDGQVLSWNSMTGELMARLENCCDPVSSLAWNRDDSQIAGSSYKTIRIWDGITGALLRTLHGHTSGLTSVAWNRENNQIISGSLDKTIKIWAEITECVDSVTGPHTDVVTSMATNGISRKTLSGSCDSTIKIWDDNSGKLLNTMDGHSAEVTSISCQPGGCLVVSGSMDKTIKIWDAEHGTLLKTHECWSNGHGVQNVVFIRDGNRVVVLELQKDFIEIWDWRTGELLKMLCGHSDWIYSVAYNPDLGKIASGSHDNTIILWDESTGILVETLKGHSGGIISLEWGYGGTKLFSGSLDKTVRIWDAISGKLLKTLHGHSGGVISISFSHDDGKIASSSNDGTIKVWDFPTARLLNTLVVSPRVAHSLSWCAGRKEITFLCDDRYIRRWDVGEITNIL